MPRFLPVLLLTAALVGCDAAEPASAIEYQVLAAGDVKMAQVSLGTAPTRTVSLPFTASASGEAFDIRAEGAGALDVSVRVDGAVREQGRGRIVRLQGRAHADKVEVEGRVEALGASTVTVAGLRFEVTDQTRFKGERGARVGLVDLAVGDRVEIDGYRTTGGLLVARKVALDDDRDDDDDEVEVEGRIEALSTASLTVAGLTFRITADTEFEDTSFADLLVGDPVEVEGFYDADGTLVASEVEADDDRDDDDDDDDDDDEEDEDNDDDDGDEDDD